MQPNFNEHVTRLSFLDSLDSDSTSDSNGIFSLRGAIIPLPLPGWFVALFLQGFFGNAHLNPFFFIEASL